MTQRIFICAVFWCLVATSHFHELVFGQAGDVPATSEYQSIAANVSEFIASEIKLKQIPALSIAIVDGDRIVWAQGFGFQDPEKGTPATAETIYRVGSVSKLLSDVAVVQLIQQGKLKLDRRRSNGHPGIRSGKPLQHAHHITSVDESPKWTGS